MNREPRRLAMESLGSRELLTALLGDTGGAERTATDDVFIDGKIITAENYDSAQQRGIIIVENTPADADNPLDEDSGHIFADYFTVLPAG